MKHAIVTTADATALRTKDAPVFYRPELDVLRFAAFFLVFLHHIFPRRPEIFESKLPEPVADVMSAIVNAFGFGLPLFFFLSAYLITKLLMIEQQASGGRIDFPAFYARRILRIWPLYFLGLAIGATIAFFAHSAADQQMFLRYVFFVGNFYFTGHDWSENPMTPLWSISIEEQFYLIAPFLIWLCGARRIILLGSLVIAVSLVSLYAQGQAHHEIDTAIWSNSLSQAIFFGSGMLCAGLPFDPGRARSATLRIGLAVLALGLLFAAAYLTEAKRLDVASSGASVAVGYALVALGCSAGLFAVLGYPRSFPPFLLYLGKISYGLYVFHLLCLMFVQTKTPLGYSKIGLVASLALTIVVASLSYRLLERPFLRLRKRFTLVANRPI